MSITQTNCNKYNKFFKHTPFLKTCSSPPGPPKNDTICKSYCIRASIDEDDVTFTGVDETYDVVENTKKVCDRYKNTCNPPIVTIIRDSKHCDGTIVASWKNGKKVFFNFK